MTFSIFSRVIYQAESKISGEVVVKEQFGKKKLYVQGTLQSGGIVRNLWDKPLKKIRNSKFEIRNSLVLGLGGGTVVKLIDKMYLKEDFVKIIGIEIDPEIIEIGKKYFGLGEMRNLRTIQADAFEYLNKVNYSLFTNHYSLILVDLYLGKNFPQKAESKKFLENIRKLLSKDSLVIFNRLRTRGENLIGFEKKLKKHFSSVEKVKTATNLFFLVKE